MIAVADWIVGGTLLLGAFGATAAEDVALSSTDADRATLSDAATGNASNAGASSGSGGHLDELVVSSRLEEEARVKALQAEKDVPKSISVVTGPELESLDALNVTEVLHRIGNVQWNFGNPMTGSLSIRGVSSSGGGTIDPSLGTTVDGVPLASLEIASELDYVDVSTISVTRGPQGSTGGLNTTMGTITVVNNTPTLTPEYHASLILGQGNAVIAQAAAGGPVIDDLLAWRATFYRDQQNGPYNNKWDGNEGRYSWDNADRSLGRLQLLYTPADDFNVLVSGTAKPNGIEFVNGLVQEVQQPYFYANGKPTYIANGLPGATNTVQNKYTRNYFTDADPNAYENYLSGNVRDNDEKGVLNSTYGGLVKVTWDLPRVTLQSITAYDYQHFQASNGVGEWHVTYDGGSDMQYNQKSEELTATSKPGGFFDYKTGFIYLQSSDWNNSASVRAIYGSDAGAYDANASQYATLSANSPGVVLLGNSLNGVQAYSFAYNANRTAAAFGQIDWHLSQPLTLTTGFRLTNENRRTSQNRGVSNDGWGGDLDPGAYGGFNSNPTTGALTANTAEQLAIANAVAEQYFGVASYGKLTAAQRKEVAAAKAVRLSTVYSGLYGTTVAQPYNGNLPSGNVSLTYKFDANLTGYLSWQHGVKAGISQIVYLDGAPQSVLVSPETSNDYEIGLKGSYFENTLVVNVDYFLDQVHNYQQTVGILDAVLTKQNGTNTYDSITSNAPGIETTGVELDAAYTGIRHLTLRFAGAYNRAFYDRDVLLADPVENGNLSPPYHNGNGQVLWDAPKFSGNLSGEYAIPVFSAKVFHTDFNYHYVSRFNSDSSGGLSRYAWVNGYGLADFGVGLGRQDRKFDVNVLVKNAFNTAYNYSQTWASYTPGLPRWFGVGFSGSF
jgi:outer membrane receptor protein involved in Fe transport